MAGQVAAEQLEKQFMSVVLLELGVVQAMLVVTDLARWKAGHLAVAVDGELAVELERLAAVAQVRVVKQLH